MSPDEKQVMQYFKSKDWICLEQTESKFVFANKNFIEEKTSLFVIKSEQKYLILISNGIVP